MKNPRIEEPYIKNQNPFRLTTAIVETPSFLACQNQMEKWRSQASTTKVKASTINVQTAWESQSKRQRSKRKLPASQSRNSDVSKEIPRGKAERLPSTRRRCWTVQNPNWQGLKPKFTSTEPKSTANTYATNTGKAERPDCDDGAIG